MPTDPNMEKRVTQKDIARAASLSISAVSMALRNDSAMSGDTLKRVKSIAQELGYSPDPLCPRFPYTEEKSGSIANCQSLA